MCQLAVILNKLISTKVGKQNFLFLCSTDNSFSHRAATGIAQGRRNKKDFRPQELERDLLLPKKKASEAKA